MRVGLVRLLLLERVLLGQVELRRISRRIVGAARVVGLEAGVGLLLLGARLRLTPLSQIAGQQRQSSQVRHSKHRRPDPQDPLGPSRRAPVPQAESFGRVPDGSARHAESEHHMHDPRHVEALRLVAHRTEHNLDDHEDKDGKTRLAVRALKVAIAASTHLDNDEDKGDQHHHKRGHLQAAVDGKPGEQGASESAHQDAGGHEDEPAEDHHDHVCNDELVARVEHARRRGLVVGARGWRQGRAVAVRARSRGRRGRRRGRRVGLGEVERECAIVRVLLEMSRGARGRVVVLVQGPDERGGRARRGVGARERERPCPHGARAVGKRLFGMHRGGCGRDGGDGVVVARGGALRHDNVASGVDPADHHVGALHLVASAHGVPAVGCSAAIGRHGHVVHLLRRAVDDAEAEVRVATRVGEQRR
ncbi:hypothetical protein L1887_45973 [Cichorium endivia]|nr:hypothetical protein L1887_45973 [Cichorium endivia]